MQGQISENKHNGKKWGWHQLAMPLFFLVFGVVGYLGIMSWSGGAGKSYGTVAASQLKQKGPVSPRYGLAGPQKVEGLNKRPVVEARTIQPTTYQHQWNLYGEIVTGRRLAMHIPVSGRLVHLSPKLHEGATFDEGDLLAAVDEFPYRAALEEAQATLSEIHAKQKEIHAQLALEELSLKQAQRQLEPARRELERMQKLFKNKAVSQKALDEAAVLVSQRESTLQQRQSNIVISRARLQQQKAAEKRQQWVLQKANRALEDSRFVAPYSGHVLSVDAEIGQYVTSSNKLATLVSGGDVEVRFTLSEDQYGNLLASGKAITGLPVHIIWRSGQIQLAFDGKVKRVGAEVAEKSGSIILYAGLGEGDVPKDQLPIGSFVDVKLSGHPIEHVARLPESALYEQDRVYLIEDSKLVSRQVQPLSWRNGEVLISAGLNEGDHVLVTHLPNAKSGLPVDVIVQ